MKFLPLGGGGEIGANSYYLNLSGTGVILDCGMHPRKIGLDALPRFDLIGDNPVDFVLISHAHQDHLSSLPFLVKKFPYIKIITTPQTRALTELVLHNSVSILKEQLGDNDELKIYTHEEIDLLIQTIDNKAYNEQFLINGYKNFGDKHIYAEFFDAGHILGSAGILIEYDNQKLFYTGDINLTNQTLLKGAEIPKSKINTLLLECTYGATESASILNWEEETLRFSDEANKIINAGGSILIPVFSLGKMQEMLAVIYSLIQKGKLANIDIYTGGISEKINRVYDYNRYVVNMIDPEFEITSIARKNLYDVQDVNDFFKNPSIVLASSGMMIPGTASFNLAKRWIKQKGSAIFTVGYMDEKTPGYKIANSSEGDKIKFSDFDKVEIIKCIIKTFRFSAHSKRENLLQIVKKLNPANVILLHGDQAAIDWMGSSVIKNYNHIRVFSAEIGKEIEV